MPSYQDIAIKLTATACNKYLQSFNKIIYIVLPTRGSTYQLVSYFIMKKANGRSEASQAQPEV